MVARSFVNPTPSQQTALPYCSEHSSRPCPGPCRKRREAEYMTEVRGNGACPIHACILHTQVCAPPYTQTKFGFQTRSGDGGWWYETPTLCSHSATLPALTFLLPPHGFHLEKSSFKWSTKSLSPKVPIFPQLDPHQNSSSKIHLVPRKS